MPLQYRLVALIQAGVTSNLPETVPQVILKMSCHSSFLSSSVLHFIIGECLVNKMRGWVTVTRKHTRSALLVCVAVCSCGSACLLWSPAVCPGTAQVGQKHCPDTALPQILPQSDPIPVQQQQRSTFVHLCQGSSVLGLLLRSAQSISGCSFGLCKMNWELQFF